MYGLAQQMVDSVFSFGGARLPGIRDTAIPDGHPGAEASRFSAASLAFRRRGRRRWGSGKPVIALGSDVDGIPQASQKPGVAYRDPIIDGAPGHGEGHNSGVPLNIVAAIAVKRIMQRDKLPGTHRALAGRRRGTARRPRPTTCERGSSRTSTSSFTTTSAPTSRRGWGDSAGNGLVSVEYTSRANRPQRQRPVARAQRARRRGADECRLELPARASPHAAAIALRDDQRRRSAERRAAHCLRLVLLPRDRLSEHQARCGKSATRWRRAQR